MDPAAALADLTEISSQVETAVLLDGEGGVLASTFADEAAARRLAETAVALLGAAGAAPTSRGREVTQLEVELREASVFVVREAARTIAATTVAEPTGGLVLYDLRACLRSLDPPKKAARQPRAGRQSAPETEAADA